MTADDLDRLEGMSSSATLDHRTLTIVFEHYGAVASAEQKAASPLVVPLGTIEAVECRPGRSTNWFWVVRRGHKPWRKGVGSDPCGVVCGVDPTAFAERVRSAVALAKPVVGDAEPAAPPAESKRSRLLKGAGRAVVDGFFNTR